MNFKQFLIISLVLVYQHLFASEEVVLCKNVPFDIFQKGNLQLYDFSLNENKELSFIIPNEEDNLCFGQYQLEKQKLLFSKQLKLKCKSEYVAFIKPETFVVFTENQLKRGELQTGRLQTELKFDGHLAYGGFSQEIDIVENKAFINMSSTFGTQNSESFVLYYDKNEDSFMRKELRSSLKLSGPYSFFHVNGKYLVLGVNRFDKKIQRKAKSIDYDFIDLTTNSRYPFGEKVTRYLPLMINNYKGEGFAFIGGSPFDGRNSNNVYQYLHGRWVKPAVLSSSQKFSFFDAYKSINKLQVDNTLYIHQSAADSAINLWAFDRFPKVKSHLQLKDTGLMRSFFLGEYNEHFYFIGFELSDKRKDTSDYFYFGQDETRYLPELPLKLILRVYHKDELEKVNDFESYNKAVNNFNKNVNEFVK